MALNLGSISAIAGAVSSVSNLLAISPMGYNEYTALPGVAPDGTALAQEDAFLFNYEGENTALIESDITDHYVEDNTALQDQIALKPETITVHGFIGELNDVAPIGGGLLKLAQSKLTLIGAFAPSVSTTAMNAINTASQVYATANSAINTVKSIGGLLGLSSPPTTKQEDAFNKFYNWWLQRRLFQVQTPWKVFTNMAIRSLRAIQDPDTRTISDFEITFKTVRFAKTSSLSVSGGKMVDGRLNAQAAGLVDQGATAAGASETQRLA